MAQGIGTNQWLDDDIFHAEFAVDNKRVASIERAFFWEQVPFARLLRISWGFVLQRFKRAAIEKSATIQCWNQECFSASSNTLLQRYLLRAACRLICRFFQTICPILI